MLGSRRVLAPPPATPPRKATDDSAAATVTSDRLHSLAVDAAEARRVAREAVEEYASSDNPLTEEAEYAVTRISVDAAAIATNAHTAATATAAAAAAAAVVASEMDESITSSDEYSESDPPSDNEVAALTLFAQMDHHQQQHGGRLRREHRDRVDRREEAQLAAFRDYRVSIQQQLNHSCRECYQLGVAVCETRACSPAGPTCLRLQACLCNFLPIWRQELADHLHRDHGVEHDCSYSYPFQPRH
jgi:hypothetical protein